MATSRKQPARRRRPAALTRERIVAAALEVIDEGGLPAFSTRRLGERLGCEAMSIYHHFPSKQHLLDALVEHAVATVDVPAPGPQPLAQLRDTLHSYRAMTRRFAALFPLISVHRHNTPRGVRFLESVLHLIRAAVPDTERAARLFRVLGYYLVGAALDETAGYARGPSAAEPASDEFIARECPCLAESAPYFQRREWDATFELGVELLLAGIESSAPRGAAPSGRPRAAATIRAPRPPTPGRRVKARSARSRRRATRA